MFALATRRFGVVVASVITATVCLGNATRVLAEENALQRGPIAESYQGQADRIINAVMAGNDAWRKMEELCDDIGHRLSGSPQLEQAVEWAVATMRREGQENVRKEKVTVPHWVRGSESLTLTKPRFESLPILGLGGSVGTPAKGITAPILVVADEEDLEARADQVRGKILLFDNPMPEYHPQKGSGYGTTVRFRSRGAQLAAKRGAVACLVRSVTATSLRSPHTGAMRYAEDGVKIPAAAISTEDADLLSRLQERNVATMATLKMEARTLSPAISHNVIGELLGSSLPDEIVVIGGHIDSWDVGTGAHDDASGCVTAMEVINVLRKLKMIPRRTIRVVLWTNEENGLAGGKEYAKRHADELANHVAAIEMDSGAFSPQGYSMECSNKEREQVALEQLRDITSLLSPIGVNVAKLGGSGADVGPMREAGVVLMGHQVEGSIYFDYHHSHADTLDKVDPTELSRNVAVMATVAYVLADMPQRFGESTK